MTKTLELPEDLFERLEAYRRARKLSRVAALDELLPRAGQADDLWLQRLLESAPGGRRAAERGNPARIEPGQSGDCSG